MRITALTIDKLYSTGTVVLKDVFKKLASEGIDILKSIINQNFDVHIFVLKEYLTFC